MAVFAAQATDQFVDKGIGKGFFLNVKIGCHGFADDIGIVNAVVDL